MSGKRRRQTPFHPRCGHHPAGPALLAGGRRTAWLGVASTSPHRQHIAGGRGTTVGNSAGCGTRGPTPRRNNHPASPNGTDPLRDWTSSRSDWARDAKSVCRRREQAKAFCRFLPRAHLLFLSGTRQKCQAGSDLSEEHRKSHINGGAGENSLVIKLPGITSTHRR